MERLRDRSAAVEEDVYYARLENVRCVVTGAATVLAVGLPGWRAERPT